MLDHLEDQQQDDGQAKESGDNEASLSLACCCKASTRSCKLFKSTMKTDLTSFDLITYSFVLDRDRTNFQQVSMS